MSTNHYLGSCGTSVIILAIFALPIPVAAQKYCPIVLDLDNSGKIEVTGQTSAFFRGAPGQFLGDVVHFDIDGDGEKEWIEWIASPVDGLLVDNRDGRAAENLNGSRLMGNADDMHWNGFEKLKEFDGNQDGSVSVSELSGFVLWQDKDLDAEYDSGEFLSLEDASLSHISLNYQEIQADKDGVHLISHAVDESGDKIFVEDVFFGEASKLDNNAIGYIPFWKSMLY